jgi:Tol biopolymer transport system component
MEIKRVPIDGGSAESVPATLIPNMRVGAATLSPDGAVLAFFATKSGSDSRDRKIALIPLAKKIASGVRMLDLHTYAMDLPAFTRDGKALVYVIRENGADNLWLQSLDCSTGRRITNFPSDSILDFKFSPNGKNLGVLREHNESDVVLLRDAGISAQ